MKTKLYLFLTVGFLLGCNNLRPPVLESSKIPPIDFNREASILTVFFGLDNALTQQARLLYQNAPGKDGMPVVFSLEVDPKTLKGSDFEVTTLNGEKFEVEYATLLPANEEFELRTVLLIGEYGNFPDNPPVAVKIIGDLMSRTGKNFKGQSKNVIPLEEGPVLSYAEYFAFDKDYPFVEQGRGCDCPKEETNTVVKVVWSGGVRALNGKELGNPELKDFTVSILQNKDTLKIHPFQLADLSDNDNNIDLCLKERGIPIFVEVNANTAIDPRDDQNPKTSVKVVSRW